MPQTQYAFRTGRMKGSKGFYGKYDAQAIGERLEELVEKFQEHLTKEEILAEARRSHSPLHKLFDWDDVEASERWRRKQVQSMMASLVVRKKGKPTRTRAFVFVKIPKHGRSCYIPLRSALGQPELRDQITQRGTRQLERFINDFGGHPGMRRYMPLVEALRKRMMKDMLELTA